jgi:chaperone modulatory protein CbpM
MHIEAVVKLFPDLPVTVIDDWIARGWVRPEGSGPAQWAFAEIDIARVRLIRDLRQEMEIDEDTLPLVLSLLDQVYATRRTLHAVLRALQSQPQSVRDTVLTAIQD